MTARALPYPTLLATLWPAEGTARPLRGVIIALAGSALLALTAKLQIPFWPVPMTMQTFAVLVIGMACGPRLGAATVGLYLLEGAVGLPVFSRGAGLGYFAGPTGGYLVGFLLAGMVVGWLAERGFDRSPGRTLLAMLAGEVVIFACGLAWLASLIGPAEAVAAGLVPFLAGEAVKIALAMVLLPGAWRLVGRSRG